jgi:hypothetical protein
VILSIPQGLLMVGGVLRTHRSTSTRGVNQRSAYTCSSVVLLLLLLLLLLLPAVGWRKEVSLRLISRAQDCIHSAASPMYVYGVGEGEGGRKTKQISRPWLFLIKGAVVLSWQSHFSLATPRHFNHVLTPFAKDDRRGVPPEGTIREGVHLHEGPARLLHRQPVCPVQSAVVGWFIG